MSGHVIADPDPRAFVADAGEYPVSGDKLARFLDVPHPENGTRNGRELRRMPLGDLLWRDVAAMPTNRSEK